MKIDYYEITVEYENKIIVAYVKSLYDRVRAYGAILTAYNDCDVVSIKPITKCKYVANTALYGWYREYVDDTEYMYAYGLYPNYCRYREIMGM